MPKKPNIDFKKIMVEKGERYGLYVALGLLVLFVALGGYVASTAASSSTITKEFDTNVTKVDQKIVAQGQKPADIDQRVYGDSTIAHIPFTQYVARNELFNITANEQTKRINPEILKPIEGQIEFVRGSVGTYDVFEDNGVRYIMILKERQVKKNDARQISRLRGNRPNPGAPGGQVRPPAPPTNPPPPNPGAAGAGGGMARGGGRPGGLGGPPGGGLADRQTETEVQPKNLADKDVDQSKFAETIDPRRMVIGNLAIPYKEQVEKYRRALRARTLQELTEFPVYRGFVVERQTWSEDGTKMVEDWTPLDMQATLGELFSKTIEFEPDTAPRDMDGATASLYPRILPPDEMELLVPRPKLYRGEYPAFHLSKITDALKALKEMGGQTAEVRTQMGQQTQDATNIFDRGTQQRSQGGGAGGAIGASGGPGGSVRPGGGEGTPSNRPGMRTQGGPPGAGGPNAQSGAQAVPEDAWAMRFIDVTVQPGYCYRYRVALRAVNPNFRKPTKELAIPSYADKEFLLSEYFELPAKDPKQPGMEFVYIPKEEFVFAATKDDARARHTEKMPNSGNWDDTWVQMQKWYDWIQPSETKESKPLNPQPFGEWLIADIKAVRGQDLFDYSAITLPLWDETIAMFVFRDKTTRRTPPGVVGPRRAEPTWIVPLQPAQPVTLVDFEGGSGQYLGPKNRQIVDTAGVEMLFMTQDGKLRVSRSGVDMSNTERTKRDQGWKEWLEKVRQDTLAAKNRGGNTGGAGGGPGRNDR